VAVSSDTVTISEGLKRQVKAALALKAKRQSWLAYRLGIEASTLSLYLNGRRDVSQELVDEMSRLLGISSDEAVTR
jgi:plasmid maintenance system antidote protein VapI